jgi:hypothetical protein
MLYIYLHYLNVNLIQVKEYGLDIETLLNGKLINEAAVGFVSKCYSIVCLRISIKANLCMLLLFGKLFGIHLKLVAAMELLCHIKIQVKDPGHVFQINPGITMTTSNCCPKAPHSIQPS